MAPPRHSPCSRPSWSARPWPLSDSSSPRGPPHRRPPPPSRCPAELSPTSVGIPPKPGKDGSYAVSPSTSKVTVVKPGSVGAGGIDPALQREIDALNPRPGATPTSPATTGATGHPDPTPAPAPPGDACSATPIPPTCPGGVPAVVIGNQTSLAGLAVFATAYPPAVAAGRNDAACSPQTAGDSDLPVAFSVNHVADVTINYSASGNAHRILSLTLHPTAYQEDQFATALAAYTGPAGTFTHLINLCTVLPNLAQGVRYAYHAIARDSNGQTAVTDGVFQLRDLAQRPPTQVTPVGKHTVNITAARATGQAMQFTVYGLPDGVDPTCAAARAHGGTVLHEFLAAPAGRTRRGTSPGTTGTPHTPSSSRAPSPCPPAPGSSRACSGSTPRSGSTSMQPRSSTARRR